MRKPLLTLPILLSFVSLVSLTHASSGDITLWNKTYTQEQAQKQIVEPLLQRIQKQKKAKIQARIVSISIKQYTNKQQSTQKQGNTNLANFYSGVVNTLKGKVNISGTGSINLRENMDTTHIVIDPMSINTYTVDGITFSLTAEQKKSSEAKVLSLKSWFCGDKWDFLMLIKQNGYSNVSYEYHFASTLSYQEYINGKMTCSVPYNANHGGLWTTSNQTGLPNTTSDNTTNQTGLSWTASTKPDINNNWWATTDQNWLSWTAEEQNRIQGEIRTIFNSYKEFWATKQQFLSEVLKQYWANSYGYQFAQTLSLGNSNNTTTQVPITRNLWLNSGAWIWGNGTNDYNWMTQTEKEHAMIEQEVNIDYNNAVTSPKATKSLFLQVIAENFGWTSSYAYQYAQTLSFSK